MEKSDSYIELSANDWLKLKHDHEQRVDDLLRVYLNDRSHQKKNPVMDFLFEYYHFRPSQLRKWTPGYDVKLHFSNEADLPKLKELKVDDQKAYLDLNLLREKRLKSAVWILELLQASASKKPAFGCFGMHEWAMVYKTDQPRHNQLPLRMDDDDLASFVESRPLICTHFDAFRFFTNEAVPLNKHELSRDNFIEMEQPGCIHSNMDLYKWAFKLYPWVSSDIILEAFEIAVEARFIDMKASPYDLEDYGLEPIKIETEQGRIEYKLAQEAIFKKAEPLRNKLALFYEHLIQSRIKSVDYA